MPCKQPWPLRTFRERPRHNSPFIMTNFWNDLPKPFFVLAPMEAVTDVVFRHVIAAAAPPDVYFTEFTNASSYCSEAGEHSTRGRLAFTPDEQPIVAQIWGNKPEQFEQMARGMAEKGFAGIDINMGCPDKTVVKNGTCSALIRQPELAAELIQAAKAGGLPVSVKTRLGFSSTDEWRDWLSHLLRQDIVNLTIHLRTKKEMSNVPAHYELIPAIKQLRDEIAPNTLLTINGDIRDRQHGAELVEKYGIDGIMIGRGVFHNPFAFQKTEDSAASSPPSFSSGALGAKYPSVLPRSAGKAEPSEKEVTSGYPSEDEDKRVTTSGAAPTSREISDFREVGADSSAGPATSDPRSEAYDGSGKRKDELIALLHLHLDLFDKYSAELEPRKFEPLKRFFKIYVRDFPGASDLREKLMHTKSTDEVRKVLSKI